MIIEATGLRKSFTTRRGRQAGRAGRTVPAVRGVDLSVAAGEAFGFLGPNGAGKTTTVRMLATLLRPDGGSARVAGHDLLAEPRAVRARIGYVSQAGGVDDGATVRDNLLLQAGLCRMPAAAARRRAGELLEALELSGLGGRMCRTLSGGQRRRLALAIGLVHEPRLLFLDEPTLGLDPQGRARLWAEVRRLRSAGTTVFLTTHYLDEADALCDRLAIIDRGTVVAQGTPAALKREIAGDVVTLRLQHGEAPGGASGGVPGGASGGASGGAPWAALVREALAGLDFVRDLRARGLDGTGGPGGAARTEGADDANGAAGTGSTAGVDTTGRVYGAVGGDGAAGTDTTSLTGGVDTTVGAVGVGAVDGAGGTGSADGADGADITSGAGVAGEAEVRVYVDSGEETLPLLLRALDRAGLSVAAATLTRPSLDDVFLSRTGRSLRDAAEPAAA